MATKTYPKRIPVNITDPKDIEYLLSLKEEDITYKFMMKTFGTFKGKVKFHPYDTFTIPIGRYGIDKKNTSPISTTVGIYIFNKYMIEKDLLPYLGYINKELNSKEVNKIINDCITPLVIEDEIPAKILTTFLMKTQKLMPMCNILSPNMTNKFFDCITMINEEKNKLAATKYAKEIAEGDVVGIERMEEELIQMAKNYLKDDPSLDIYLSGARSNIGNHFKNMYICKGAIKNSDPNAEKAYSVALSNYNSGISKEEYSLFAQALVDGPYSRGKKTEIGGFWEKLFIAAFQHIKIVEKDCKTTDGIDITLTKDNLGGWIYSNIINSDGSTTELTNKNADKYMGKIIKIRYTGLCESKEGYCEKCCGGLAKLKNKNIGIMTEKIPSSIKNGSMKAFHDSSVKTAEIDLDRAFNYMNR